MHATHICSHRQIGGQHLLNRPRKLRGHAEGNDTAVPRKETAIHCSCRCCSLFSADEPCGQPLPDMV